MDIEREKDKVELEHSIVEIPRTTSEFLIWLWNRIWSRRKWWLIPAWILLVVLGTILFLTGNGALLPAIYVAF